MFTIGGAVGGFVPFARYVSDQFPDDDYVLDKVFVLATSVIAFGCACIVATWMTWPGKRESLGVANWSRHKPSQWKS
jgi:hypothetical protein